MDKIDDNGGFLETRSAPLYDELLGVGVPVLREPIPMRLAVVRQHPVVDVPVNLALELPLRRESLLVFPVEIVAKPKQDDKVNTYSAFTLELEGSRRLPNSVSGSKIGSPTQLS